MIRPLAPSEFCSSEFRALLRQAVELSGDELGRIVDAELPLLEVLGYMRDDVLVGFVAFEYSDQQTTIEYIAVADGAQRCGIGSALVEVVANATNGGVLCAQTDDDAVDFYRRLAFNVEVGTRDNRWPDRTRYDCWRP